MNETQEINSVAMDLSYNSEQPSYWHVKQALYYLTLCLQSGDSFRSAHAVSDYFRCQLAGEFDEVFAVMYLNNQNCLLRFSKLFRGTINAAAVYARPIVREAIAVNAATVILAHNHPGGSMIPSGADQSITQQLKDTLALVDVRVLDHIIVSATGFYSFKEHNLL